ncbi:response regulator receiver domain-containing protein [Paraburkholderia eburnea]|uniref:Response regulator receiver domain-containing protein n=1 Tax=Paraburkholderia eburnea TaxID=1189126 RepID=A0A2S4LSW3_9BURK|nr:response regulator [Paraburkholderia eburnea]POR45520.1 response regulator receiver domain-containing protein [Paraburkholderia eburnea]PRZ13788.1 response regulator receiver domain-containing protein [Paraburkholderia eburnea]
MDMRILIADDDEKSLAGLSTLLADLQYATAIAATLDDAAETATRFVPDVLVVGLSLAPDGDFGELAQRLRVACGAHMPLLIALGGWGESQHRDAALAAGFDVHLVRPVGLDQLTFILSMVA